MLLKFIYFSAYLLFLIMLLSAIYQGPAQKLMENRTEIREDTIDLWGKIKS